MEPLVPLIRAATFLDSKRFRNEHKHLAERLVTSHLWVTAGKESDQFCLRASNTYDEQRMDYLNRQVEDDRLEIARQLGYEEDGAACTRLCLNRTCEYWL